MENEIQEIRNSINNSKHNLNSKIIDYFIIMGIRNEEIEKCNNIEELKKKEPKVISIFPNCDKTNKSDISINKWIVELVENR
jgi:hypothetical protein